MIRRSAKEGEICVNPRGDRQFSINTPIPYRQWKKPVPCIKDQALLADYYQWQENEGWAYAYSANREFDKHGNLLNEQLVNRTSKELLAEYSYRYDEQGRMVFAERMEQGAFAGSLKHEQEFFTYESNSGILLRDSLVALTTDGWKTSGVRWWKLFRDEEGILLTVTASAYEGHERSDDVMSRLEYSGERLTSITQSVFHFGMNAPLPVFRYIRTGESAEDFTEFSSSLFSNGEWSEFRKDRSGKMDDLEWFLGDILSPEEDLRSHKNELEYDEKGNLIRTSQYAYSRSEARWETVADLRFIIEYGENGINPKSVVTTRRDSAGVTHNSMKVVYDPAQLSMRTDARLITYPNPAYGIVRINWEGVVEDPTRLQLVDESGRLVIDRPVRSGAKGDESIEVTKLPAGNYTVRLTVGQQLLQSPLMVAH
ncbi:MAG: Secretion system C-terminal sorting domain [Bacteroidota bacterium]